MRHGRLRVLAGTAAVAMVSAGCGVTAAALPTPPDACAAVPKEAAARALGMPVRNTGGSTVNAGSSCSYLVGELASVTLNIDELHATVFEPQRYFTERTYNHPATPINGLGSQARSVVVPADNLVAVVAVRPAADHLRGASASANLADLGNLPADAVRPGLVAMVRQALAAR